MRTQHSSAGCKYHVGAGVEAPQGVSPFGINFANHLCTNLGALWLFLQEMQECFTNLLNIDYLQLLAIDGKCTDVILLSTWGRVECRLFEDYYIFANFWVSFVLQERDGLAAEIQQPVVFIVEVVSLREGCCLVEYDLSGLGSGLLSKSDLVIKV